jgi:two-component system, chemotaxis family, chemotaxis protein CheY
MRILIAEDDADLLESYKDALENRNHEVFLTGNGEECLRIYREELKQTFSRGNRNTHKIDTPFDAVVLDYIMPKKDGMQVAREILKMNPTQRIIFASGYVEQTLEDTVKQLKQVVELMQKPFGADTLVSTIEDKEVYNGLKELMLSMKQIKDLSPTPKQMRSLLENLRKIQKGRTF